MMPVFYNNEEYLDAAAANRARLQQSMPYPVIRDGKGWQVWSAPEIECKTSDGLKRIEKAKVPKRVLRAADRKKVLSNIMKEHDLSVSDVCDLLNCKPMWVSKWMSETVTFSQKREFDLLRAIAAAAPVAKINEETDYKEPKFNVSYHGRPILLEATPIKVKTHLDNLLSDRIKIEKRGDWQLIYKQSRLAPECVFAKSDDIGLLILSFIRGAMRGLCAGYSFEIA